MHHERNAGDRFGIWQMEQKSDFERDKIRADQLMEKEKYLAAIYRYKHLLDEADTKETSEVLREISGITSERRMHVSFV